MFGLFVIGFFAGVIAGVSPCILPVLPVVLVGWSAPVAGAPDPVSTLRARRRRAVAVVLGLVLSFSLITAVGSVVLSSLGLPDNLLHDLGIAMLILFGLGLLFPQIERLLEKPFARLTRAAPTGTRSGFVLGLGLGLVFVPCAGPVLAAISVLGARHHASFYSVLLSFCFAVGAATPLLIVALAGDRLIERNRSVSARARQLRPVAGALLLVMAGAIAFNLTSVLQRTVPSYTESLQHWIEGNSFTTNQLHALQNGKNNGSLAACESQASANLLTSLGTCGTAPSFTGITAWLNTPGHRPLTMHDLRGHVVLVDFWTYSCINCQRTLPHVESWFARYHKYGLDVFGIESPEFAFEHVVSNVAAASQSLGVRYPVAVDNNLATWTAYQNSYWPAEYLVDASGTIRHVAYGEGSYSASESFIRTLLHEANPKLVLPPPTNVANETPKEPTNPETYLGTARSQFLENGTMTNGVTSTYQLPPDTTTGAYSLGGQWTPSPEGVTAGLGAQLVLNFQAQHVYLVLGGTGTVEEKLNGVVIGTIHVHGYPTLYPLLSTPRSTSGLLRLSFSPGVEAYDFTFG